jgi:hypothetical protein
MKHSTDHVRKRSYLALSIPERTSLLIHAAQSEVLGEMLTLVDDETWRDAPIEKYREMLHNYIVERKRQTDECAAPEECGIFARLDDELRQEKDPRR